MSDYITTLRQDLVEAAERQQQRSPAARLARPAHPRNWSPLALLGAATALAAVVAVVVVLRGIEPAPQPTDKQIVTTLRLGGEPRDAVAVGDLLVVADYDGSLYSVPTADPTARRRFGFGTRAPVSITAVGGAVWVTTPDRFPKDGTNRPPHHELLKADPRSGRLLARVPLESIGDALRAGATGVWLPGYLEVGSRAPRQGAQHADALGDLVVGRRSAWTRTGDTVFELDSRGRIVRKVSGVADAFALATAHTIAPDKDGAWVVGQASGVLYRIEGERVTQRVTVGVTAGVLAIAGSSVWVSAIESPGEYELVRVDRDSGRITGRVRLGRAAPQVIAPAGDRLWVLTSGGDAMLINPDE